MKNKSRKPRVGIARQTMAAMSVISSAQATTTTPQDVKVTERKNNNRELARQILEAMMFVSLIVAVIAVFGYDKNDQTTSMLMLLQFFVVVPSLIFIGGKIKKD